MSAVPGRRVRRRVDGILLLDKGVGRSSNAVLQHARHLFAAEKAGHTGTLDPLASGLLPLCFGEATKFAQGLLDARKGYVATIHFGLATRTGDAEGEVIAERPVAFHRAELERVLGAFVGAILQLPPLYSALKFQGRSYYEHARAGNDIPRTPRRADIFALELVEWAPPLATLRVDCGKGTYVRTLAEDIAAALGSCAHLAGLRRTCSGPFAVEQAVTLEALEGMALEARDSLLLPIHAALSDLPRLIVPPSDADALLAGRAVPNEAAGGRYGCFDAAGRFIGTVEADGVGIRPVRLISTDGGQATLAIRPAGSTHP